MLTATGKGQALVEHSRWLSLAEAMECHLEALKEESLALGDTEGQAERSARMKLGNCTAIEETVGETVPLHSVRVIAPAQ